MSFRLIEILLSRKNVITKQKSHDQTFFLLILTKVWSQFSQCVGGRKISYEKSATGFSLKLGQKKTRVIQEFDAFTSNVGVDPDRYFSSQVKQSSRISKS